MRARRHLDQAPPKLDREEFVEQAYFFRSLGERMPENTSTQDLMLSLREEVLSTTRLPMAIDFLVSELKFQGVFSPGMARLKHYFTPFQTFLVAQAEEERGRFDFKVAIQILQREAEYRAAGATPQGLFLFEFECLCRNRLRYDRGLDAMAGDPTFDADWKQWINTVRRQIGLVDLADLIYVRSEYYRVQQQRQGHEDDSPHRALFGEKEGKIAMAHRRKDPLWLLAALERHLGYPTVPRPKRPDETREVIPSLLRRMERVETRVKLLEEEARGGIDLTKFYPPPQTPNSPDTKK